MLKLPRIAPRVKGCKKLSSGGTAVLERNFSR